MAATILSSLVAAAILLSSVECSKVFSAYFPNWAHQREPPYTFRPENLSEIVDRLDHLIFAYAHIDWYNNSIVLTGANDAEFLQDLASYKQQQYNLRVLISVGGENFPSANFSAMAASYDTRAAFVQSVKRLLYVYSLDGIDINWRFPCSKEKMIFLEEWESSNSSCEAVTFRAILDPGGKCPDDADNLLYLVQELRASLPNGALITLLGPQTKSSWKKLDLKKLSNYIDYWHVATYDYTVPALNYSFYTAPNSPLNQPPKFSSTVPWNINTTVHAYLSAGVPSSKLLPGVPIFGHAWYIPIKRGSKWQNFGIRATIQGLCCGPFKTTYGARYGKISRRCGTFMYSEIVRAKPQVYYDKTTQTAIGFLKYNSNDGWLKKGTWFTFNNKNSIEALTNFVAYYKLGGAFVYDVSQDSLDVSSEKFTFELMEAVYVGLQGTTSGYICNPAVGCNVCYECCRSYLTNQFDCDACVAVRCNSRQCYPQSSCNVCSLCCKQHFQSRDKCHNCVSTSCS